MKNIQQIFIEFKPFIWALIPKKTHYNWYSGDYTENVYRFLCFSIEIRYNKEKI